MNISFEGAEDLLSGVINPLHTGVHTLMKIPEKTIVDALNDLNYRSDEPFESMDSDAKVRDTVVKTVESDKFVAEMSRRNGPTYLFTYFVETRV